MKKPLSLLIGFLFFIGSCIAAYAAEIDNTTEKGKTTVSYETNSTYTITIPAFISPEEKATTEMENKYSVTASNVFIPDGTELGVTVDYDGILTENNGVEIPYKLYSDNTEISNGQKIITKAAGSLDDTATFTFSAAIQEKAKYAGVYTDTVTFNVSVTDKTYSLEEIEKNDHLFAIGRTKPEYVVARFNEDYTEVTIFKNGENSDGWMKNFSYSSPPPTAKCRDILERAVVKDGVKNLTEQLFSSCSQLSSVELPESLIELGMLREGSREDYGYPGVFRECKNLKHISLPSNLKMIGHSTFSESGLEEIEIPDSVEKIGQSAFYICKDLSNVKLPQGLETIPSRCFLWNPFISINIPNTVTEIGTAAFSGVDLKDELYIPDSVISIGTGAFDSCDIESISGMKNVQYIGNFAFQDCRSLKSVQLCEGLESIGERAFGFFADAYINVDFNIPSTVKEIGDGAFAMAKSITVAPENESFCVKDGIFYSKDMTRILRMDANNELVDYVVPTTVTNVDSYAFTKCNYLESINLRNTKISSIKERTFQSCSNLQQIFLPDQMESIEKYAFEHDEALQKIVMPKELKSLGSNVFGYCDAINEFVIPNGITTIPSRCFWDCNALKIVKMSDTVTRIEENAFGACDRLTDIEFSNNLQFLAEEAFYNCGFFDIVLPESVSVISALAFEDCKNLTSVTIPNSTASIDASAFNNSLNLTTVYGKAGSTAESFAADKGYTFIAI